MLFNELSDEMVFEPFTMTDTPISIYTATTIQQESAAIFHPPRG
ncbi:hypothetical protein [Paraflavitalea speifideaquila]|nr:hypothetical protein [Paraflavitalea speifideiaquila]